MDDRNYFFNWYTVWKTMDEALDLYKQMSEKSLARRDVLYIASFLDANCYEVRKCCMAFNRRLKNVPGVKPFWDRFDEEFKLCETLYNEICVFSHKLCYEMRTKHRPRPIDVYAYECNVLLGQAWSLVRKAKETMECPERKYHETK